jgi:hypothetical protein
MPALFGLIAIVCALYAIFQVITSSETTVNKTVWTILILILPVVGFIIWIIAGPRGRKLLQK